MIHLDLFNYRLFNDLCNSLRYIGSNDDGLETMRKARVVSRFEAMSPHVTGGTREEQAKPEEVVSRPKFGSVI